MHTTYTFHLLHGALKKLAGKDLFQYVGEDGAIVNIRRRHINDYIKEVMGERFSAKDFRTWAGTLIAACELARMSSSGEIVEGRTDRRKMMVAAVKETAAQLGNTPSVCKASYIWPSVLHSFEKGAVLTSYFKTMDELIEHRARGQHAAEKALLELLKTGRSALPARKARRSENRLSRRMRQDPKARRLAKAFTLH